MRKTVLALMLLTSLLLSSCTVERKASGAQWLAEEQLLEYKWVYFNTANQGTRWVEVDSISNSGNFGETIQIPDTFTCLSQEPEIPNIGDRVCISNIRYFLIFENKWYVEVEEATWQSHTTDTIYKTERTWWGITITEEN